MYLSMFGFSGFEISMIIGYEKSYFFKKKMSIILLKKSIGKYYPSDNSGDFWAMLTFYELCKS